jgi:hypothetical protein
MGDRSSDSPDSYDTAWETSSCDAACDCCDDDDDGGGNVSDDAISLNQSSIQFGDFDRVVHPGETGRGGNGDGDGRGGVALDDKIGFSLILFE